MNPFDTVQSATKSFKKGEIIIVTDDESRENEGDLILAAEKATVKKINFILKEARGLLCVPLTQKRAKYLELELMTPPRDAHCTSFTVSVDAKRTGTGISAADRTKTIKMLVSKRSSKNSFVKPGHVFPLIAKDGGVLRRPGHSEAAIDLCKLAGLEPVGVICEIMNEDGTMARLPDLIRFKKKHRLKLICIKDMISYFLSKKKTSIKKVSDAFFPTRFGQFRLIGFEEKHTGFPLLALIKGNVKGKKNVLVRVHSACLTGDALNSLRCDCGKQLERAMKMIQKEKLGVVLYIPSHEGRGIGLLNKVRAYHLQDHGFDTYKANNKLGFLDDERDYGSGAQVLKALGLSSIKLITNNPAKKSALEGFGLKFTGRIPLKIKPNKFNKKYIETKNKKHGYTD
jgi:3,4-dihydroxy 2-butanone 4-phosphate synthase / GTP cyclohydrolase II